jgi:hypothetical protein
MHQSFFKPPNKPQPLINWQPAQVRALPMIENSLIENPLTDPYMALLFNNGPSEQNPAVAVTS